MSEIYKKWLEPKPKELQKQPPIGQKRSKIVWTKEYTFTKS